MAAHPARAPFHQRPSYNVAIVGIFAPILGIFAILAWIVPFGHITMEFAINTVIVLLLRLKRKTGTLAVTGTITGIIDFSAGLAGPGGFLAPAVYALRFGFLEWIAWLARQRPDATRDKVAILANAAGYFITTTFIWTMYAMLFIPLGDATVQRMWFVFGAIGTVTSVPATMLGLAAFKRFLEPALRHTQFLEGSQAGSPGTS